MRTRVSQEEESEWQVHCNSSFGNRRYGPVPLLDYSFTATGGCWEALHAAVKTTAIISLASALTGGVFLSKFREFALLYHSENIDYMETDAQDFVCVFVC